MIGSLSKPVFAELMVMLLKDFPEEPRVGDKLAESAAAPAREHD